MIRGAVGSGIPLSSPNLVGINGVWGYQDVSPISVPGDPTTFSPPPGNFGDSGAGPFGNDLGIPPFTRLTEAWENQKCFWVKRTITIAPAQDLIISGQVENGCLVYFDGVYVGGYNPTNVEISAYLGVGSYPSFYAFVPASLATEGSHEIAIYCMDETVTDPTDVTYLHARVDAFPAGLTAYSAVVMSLDPVAYYQHGAVIPEIDSSLNLNHCTVSTAIATDTPLIDNGAGTYNGTTSNQQAPNVAGLNEDLTAGSGIVTVAALCYVTNLAANRTICAKGRVQHSGWRCAINSAGAVSVTSNFATTEGAFTSPNGVITTNTWKHIVGIVQGDATDVSGVRKIYVNGVSQTITHVSNPSGAKNSDAPYSLNLGMRRNNAGTANEVFYAGRMEKLAIWDRELTVQEVTALFAQTGL